MNAHLRAILDELYALEPQLKRQEASLIPLLETMLKRKPDAVPNPAFVQQLRMQLRDMAATRNAQRETRTSSFFSFFSMTNYPIAVTGAILGAVITGPIVYSIVSSNGQFAPLGDGDTPAFTYSIEETSDEAFGDLAAYSPMGQGGGGGERTQSGGGGVASDASNMMIDPKIGIFPAEVTQYNFVIEGDLPELTAAQVDVLKRQKGMSGPAVRNILSSFNTGMIDLTSFGSAQMDSVNFYQDEEFGYMFYINFREGSIAINQNWQRWPHPENGCQDEACFRSYQITIDQIPADERVIAIAQEFAEDHGVDLSSYGAPEVDNAWRVYYEASDDKSNYYVPDVIRVVFPLLVEGKPVYDEGGSKAGISIGVNVRHDRVADAWGIMDQRLLSSSYAGVTDPAQITAFLDTYGDQSIQWMPEGSTVRTVDVTLGTPEQGFMKMYVWDDANAMGDELVIPALIFPVTSGADQFYRTNIAVPLAQDMLDKMINPMPVPMPRPLIMEDTPAETTDADAATTDQE